MKLKDLMSVSPTDEKRYHKILSDKSSFKALLDKSLSSGKTEDDLIGAISMFIDASILKLNPLFHKNEDLFMECWLQVWDALQKYNPEKGSPTTLMYYSIRTAIKNFSAYYNSTSTYYVEKFEKLRKENPSKTTEELFDNFRLPGMKRTVRLEDCTDLLSTDGGLDTLLSFIDIHNGISALYGKEWADLFFYVKANGYNKKEIVKIAGNTHTDAATAASVIADIERYVRRNFG